MGQHVIREVNMRGLRTVGFGVWGSMLLPIREVNTSPKYHGFLGGPPVGSKFNFRKVGV